MKRELAAGLLLLALICGAIYNIFYVGELVRDISAELYASQEALAAGSGERAEEYAETSSTKMARRGAIHAHLRAPLRR